MTDQGVLLLIFFNVVKESACKITGTCYNKGVPSYLDERQMNAF